MENNNMIAILTVIIGLLFIIFPIFIMTLVSVFVGFSVLIAGIILLIAGFSIMDQGDVLPWLNMIVGIIGIIFGLLFIFSFNAISFVAGIQFYVLGFILIFLGISGFFAKLRVISSISSIIMLVLGIVSLLLGAFAFNHPEILSIFVGICFILQGIRMYLD